MRGREGRRGRGRGRGDEKKEKKKRKSGWTDTGTRNEAGRSQGGRGDENEMKGEGTDRIAHKTDSAAYLGIFKCFAAS